MRSAIKTLAVVLGVLGAASIAVADEADQSGPGAHMPGMTQDKGMMDRDDMSGMMGMMQMMQQMGPMMEQCSQMMAAMTGQMRSAPDVPSPQDDNG